MGKNEIRYSQFNLGPYSMFTLSYLANTQEDILFVNLIKEKRNELLNTKTALF